MLTSRTPYRISFFGGGTDYSNWFKDHGGSFISLSIDKYCYLSLRSLPPFFEYNNRVVWSKIEQVRSIDEIQHPAIRAGLKMTGVNNVEIHHMGDLPARSGLGSSSSFSVGLLNLLSVFQRRDSNNYLITKDAIRLERDILGEAGGIQDQIAASFGGFNYVEIMKDGEFQVEKVKLSREQTVKLEQSLLLVFTGIFRNSHEIASDKIENMKVKEKHLEKISNFTQIARKVLEERDFIQDFGSLLNETWQEKRQISSKISNACIDKIYKEAIDAGAIGGKLLGAGAGGFMVFIVDADKMERVKSALSGLIQIPVAIDFAGTTIL